MEISSRELAVILDSTHDGMIAVNREGAVTLFNAAAERLTGLKREEVIGRKAQEAIPNTRLHIVLETGVPELNQQQHLGKTTIITNRVPVKDEEGRVVGAVAVFRDVGDFEALAEELTNVRQIKTMLEAIINATNDAISVVDENGMQILINPAYTRLTGLTEADVLYKPATVDIVEGESMHYKVLRTRQPVRGVRMKIGPNKKEVMVNVAPIIVNNELKGSVGVIHDLSEIKKLTEELEHARRLIRHLEAKYTFDDIIGQSEELKLAVEQAERAAATPATVLLRGESGTGKELFAHAIHNASTRSSQKFIRVNCASLTDTLLESELFGYEEGAFTGAVKGGKRGLFEEANGGTIFLDEIGEISLTLQAKLLRVLQEKEVRRVGGTKAVPVDVRVIAATNANLEEKIREGSFREDLYYRLNVFPIFIPPLRRRKQDLPLLVRFLIGKFNREFGRQVERIEPEALKVLENYDWPGNVRELENVIGRAIINMRPGDTVIAVRHLPSLGLVRPQVEGEHRLPDSGWQGETLDEILARVERQVICDVLAQCGGNKTLAARKLNIAVRSLYYKMDRYGLR
ncbi:PAS domain S-box-containing protein [Carboxydocella sporoproducens DSM 16521]|uniref:PAS domain S-box-containing protein n=2 Tax=Carboxydocella TaxID=178898 RepID=A0A1T4NID3_9FIRM|nr:MULTISPECIES: sigma-54-dependent Fis family transcriptional regulator [Carboxydocella]AVX20060.1 PAS domain S-box-containing protein [Carboxydocella thermautotrophica]AVX30477.1 PAS domain S-box-containing protein [Carboxydocella thermautotrophica]SJZ79081.1 PAS domain S-box-containing protein [Carboxydocella sporoproducens DSM 16521]